MSEVTLFGASYSVYVRIARLALQEAAVPYALVEVDIFDTASLPADYSTRHPFGKIPAFEHAGLQLYETDAIAWYVAEALGGQALIPKAPRERARMRQIMRICDNYAYPRLVWGVFVEEISEGRAGQLTEREIEVARETLAVLEEFLQAPYFGGDAPSLADLWAVPMLIYLRLAPTGKTLLAESPKLTVWLDLMRQRPSVGATASPKEGGSESVSPDAT